MNDTEVLNTVIGAMAEGRVFVQQTFAREMQLKDQEIQKLKAFIAELEQKNEAPVVANDDLKQPVWTEVQNQGRTLAQQNTEAIEQTFRAAYNGSAK